MIIATKFGIFKFGKSRKLHTEHLKEAMLVLLDACEKYAELSNLSQEELLSVAFLNIRQHWNCCRYRTKLENPYVPHDFDEATDLTKLRLRIFENVLKITRI